MNVVNAHLGSGRVGENDGPPRERSRDRVKPSRFRAVAGTFWSNKSAAVGAIVLICVVLFCFVGPHVYRTQQLESSITNANLAPSSQFPLGTDSNGFNVLGRLMVGGQATLEVAAGVGLLASALGLVWGAISGYMRGLGDAFMSRIVDTLMSIPSILVFIYLATRFRPSVPLLIIVISGLSWLVPARLIRAETLSLRERDYIQAARGAGARAPRIVGRHIATNTIGTLVVSATFQVATAILIVATLSFLGFGLQPPIASWGHMLQNGLTFLYDGYWWEVYPAAAMILLTIVCVSMIGDGLRDALDVRLQER